MRTYSEQILFARSKSLKSSISIFLHCTSLRSDNEDVSQGLHEQLVGQVEFCITEFSSCKVVLPIVHSIRIVFQEKIKFLVSIWHESDSIWRSVGQSTKLFGTENRNVTRRLSERTEWCFHHFRCLKWSKTEFDPLIVRSTPQSSCSGNSSCYQIKSWLLSILALFLKFYLEANTKFKLKIWKIVYAFRLNASEAQNTFYQG